MADAAVAKIRAETLITMIDAALDFRARQHARGRTAQARCRPEQACAVPAFDPAPVPEHPHAGTAQACSVYGRFVVKSLDWFFGFFLASRWSFE